MLKLKNATKYSFRYLFSCLFVSSWITVKIHLFLAHFCSLTNLFFYILATEETYSATVAIVLGLLAFLIVIAIVIALVYYCYKRKKRLEAEALKKKEEEDRLERIERERKERIRMEKAALTPTLDLGLPDDSVYDITRLFYEDEEPVTPTKVETDLNERLIDRDNEVCNLSYLTSPHYLKDEKSGFGSLEPKVQMRFLNNIMSNV